jgi:hypothetical protein
MKEYFIDLSEDRILTFLLNQGNWTALKNYPNTYKSIINNNYMLIVVFEPDILIIILDGPREQEWKVQIKDFQDIKIYFNCLFK